MNTVYDDCDKLDPSINPNDLTTAGLGSILCPRCRQKGRSGAHGKDPQHLKEKSTGYCRCCRREYQRAYYRERKDGNTGPAQLAHALAQVERLRKQIRAWYAAGEIDAADSMLLGELQGWEEKIGLDPILRTTKNRLLIELKQAELDARLGQSVSELKEEAPDLFTEEPDWTRSGGAK